MGTRMVLTSFLPSVNFCTLGSARAAKNPRWFLGHVLGFVYIGVGIILANWMFKNYMLVFRGIDLIPLWPY